MAIVFTPYWQSSWYRFPQQTGLTFGKNVSVSRFASATLFYVGGRWFDFELTARMPLGWPTIVYLGVNKKDVLRLTFCFGKIHRRTKTQVSNSRSEL